MTTPRQQKENLKNLREVTLKTDRLVRLFGAIGIKTNEINSFGKAVGVTYCVGGENNNPSGPNEVIKRIVDYTGLDVSFRVSAKQLAKRSHQMPIDLSQLILGKLLAKVLDDRRAVVHVIATID